MSYLTGSWYRNFIRAEERQMIEDLRAAHATSEATAVSYTASKLSEDQAYALSELVSQGVVLKFKDAYYLDENAASAHKRAAMFRAGAAMAVTLGAVGFVAWWLASGGIRQ